MYRILFILSLLIIRGILYPDYGRAGASIIILFITPLIGVGFLYSLLKFQIKKKIIYVIYGCLAILLSDLVGVMKRAHDLGVNYITGYEDRLVFLYTIATQFIIYFILAFVLLFLLEKKDKSKL